MFFGEIRLGAEIKFRMKPLPCNYSVILYLVLLTSTPQCLGQKNVTSSPSDDEEHHRPGFPIVSPNTPVMDESSLVMITIDQIITPSDTCKEIVEQFASAISNFTQCSVTNSRPIHLCGWCIAHYLSVKRTYHDLFVTVDEKGNPCKEYFTNLDRIEIVADAFNYVQNLWKKGSCDYCFKHSDNGTLLPEVTTDVSDFILLFEMTKSCFNSHMDKNNTCTECKERYDHLNSVYLDMVAKYVDNMCLDLVDTMNTTRALWSELYHCNPPRQPEIWLHVGMGVLLVIPVIFYLLAYLTADKQVANVLQQRRLAELLITSNSGGTEGSGYVSMMHNRSPTVSSSRSRSASTSAKTPSDPPLAQSQN